jgi:hypothetical protein
MPPAVHQQQQHAPVIVQDRQQQGWPQHCAGINIQPNQTATTTSCCQHCLKVQLTQPSRLHAASVLHARSLTLLLLLLLLGFSAQAVALLPQLLMQRLQLRLRLLRRLVLLLGFMRSSCACTLPVGEDECWLPVWCHGPCIFVQHAHHSMDIREEGVAVSTKQYSRG